ncbi:unnamed protein product, partial [Rotaria sordida]
ITNTEQKYKLVIFPSDNTFSIFNNKQCSNSEHDGLITVQSGSKKYLAMVFKVGTMAELHEAQKLLGKAMNIVKCYKHRRKIFKTNINGTRKTRKYDSHVICKLKKNTKRLM